MSKGIVVAAFAMLGAVPATAAPTQAECDNAATILAEASAASIICGEPVNEAHFKSQTLFDLTELWVKCPVTDPTATGERGYANFIRKAEKLGGAKQACAESIARFSR